MNKKIKITIAVTFILVVLGLLSALIFSIYSGNESNIDQVPEQKPVATPVPTEIGMVGDSEEVEDNIEAEVEPTAITPEDNVVYLGEINGEPTIFITNEKTRTYSQLDPDLVEDEDQIGKIPGSNDSRKHPIDEVFTNIQNPEKIFEINGTTWLEPSSIFTEGDTVYFGTYEVRENYESKDGEEKVLFMDDLDESKIYKYENGQTPELIWEFNTHSDKYKTHSGRAKLFMVQNGYAVIFLEQCFQCGPEDRALSIIVNLETKEETTLERALVTNIESSGIVTYQNYSVARREAFPVWELDDEFKTLQLN